MKVATHEGENYEIIATKGRSYLILELETKLGTQTTEIVAEYCEQEPYISVQLTGTIEKRS